MNVDIVELQKIFSYLMDSFKKKNGHKVEVGCDFYWDISSNEIYNPYDAPKNLTLGQLTDDWKTLKDGFASDNLVPYDIKRIANILKALSIERPI